MATIVEKVIQLQTVDVFSEVPTERLALVAAIAEEVTFEAGASIYRKDDPSDSMYIVLEGKVRLHRDDIEVTAASAGEAFGTWALFDDEARVTSATALVSTKALRIGKEDFIDVLADNVDITQGVLKTIVKRLRALASRFGGTS